MNNFLLWAGVISFVVGLVHSVLGEVLIFKNLRSGTVIPTIGEPLLKERNIRILWATWHIVTVFGWALGGILLFLSTGHIEGDLDATAEFLVSVIGCSMFICSVLVLVATKARHPGWLGLLSVAVLCWLA